MEIRRIRHGMAVSASIRDRDLRQLSQVNGPRKVKKISMPVKFLLRHGPVPLKIMPQHGPRKVQKIMPVTPSLPPRHCSWMYFRCCGPKRSNSGAARGTYSSDSASFTGKEPRITIRSRSRRKDRRSPMSLIATPWTSPYDAAPEKWNPGSRLRFGCCLHSDTTDRVQALLSSNVIGRSQLLPVTKVANFKCSWAVARVMECHAVSWIICLHSNLHECVMLIAVHQNDQRAPSCVCCLNPARAQGQKHKPLHA